ncbi:MAG: FkbM family methyltransferase [Phycisphaerae bacterium]
MGLRRAIRSVIVGTPVEALARNVFSRLDPRCRASTGEMRDNPQMFEIMRRVLKEDSAAIDIGANEGKMLEVMVAAAPRGQIMAFEPIPQLAQSLRERFPNVEVRCLALSDSPGSAQFEVARDIPGHSSLKATEKVKRRGHVESIPVTVETLDRVVDPARLVRLIKIDVEGAEYHVVGGALATLRRCRPFVVFEFEQRTAAVFQVTAEMMYDRLTGELGMKISRMNDWLEGRGPLDRGTFGKIYRQGLLWNFLAHW